MKTGDAKLRIYRQQNGHDRRAAENQQTLANLICFLTDSANNQQAGCLYREETMTPKRLLQTISFNLILIVSLTISVFPAHAAELSVATPDFTNFVNAVKNGQGGVLRGAFVQDLFALRIVQQPSTNPNYVSPVQGVATEFQAATNAGNIGLLAHNYLAGQNFPSLMKGQEVRIIFGDGKIEYYRIVKILRYQTLEPQSTTSDFLDLDSGERLSAAQTFKKVYEGARHVTLQTCIANNGNASWGRLFIIAEPFTPQ